MDRIILKGELKPDFKIKSVKIKGNEARITDNSFETGDIQLKEGMNSMLIELTDVNGRRRLVSYAVVYEPRPSNPGGGSPVLTLDMTAEGYTAPAQKKLSTRTIRRTASVSAPAAQTNPNLDVVFSSPYANQVITEDKLKIGGRFNKDAGIASITVNGQACTLDLSSGTFEGPMLISPGEARRKKINSNSAEYIVMRVNPENHSGMNELKVIIRPNEGKAYEDRVAYWYYKMFVMTHVSGNDVYNLEDGFQMSTPRQTIQSYNKDLLEEPPFGGWPYPEKGYRYDIPLNRPGLYYYNDDSVPYYFTESYPLLYYYTGLDTYMGHGYIKTYIKLHSPPIDKKPFVIVLKNCSFLEDLPFFPRYTISSISGYKINGVELAQLGPEPRTSYVVLDNVDPDTDFSVSVDTPYYGEGFRIYQGYIDRHFAAEFHEGLTGDILVDSNNDGFLGGEDNAVEQIEPGCVFWVNDDDDYDEMDEISPYNLHCDDMDAVNSNGNDSADQAVNGIRDLEDFMPINITIDNISEWINHDVKFFLRTEGEGKVRVFKRVKDTREYGAKTYLCDINSSIAQYQEDMKFILPAPEREGQLLDPSWFGSEGKFYGVYEGVNAGTLKIILEAEIGIHENKKKIVLDEAVITFKDLNDMYKFCNVRYNTLGYGTVAGTDRILVDNKYQGTEKDNSGVDRYLYNHEVGAIYPQNPQKIFIWTHGYYNDAEESKIVIDTIYKRMYRTGYRGAFIGITWHAHEGWTKMAFNADWINSFQSGRIIADIVTKYKSKYSNATISLSAHSLGNNALCYALRCLSTNNTSIIDDIILAEAAMPAESFSAVTMYKLLPFGTIEYMDHYFEDIYGIDTGVIKGKIYNTYSTNDEVLGRAYPLNISMSGLETPLDYNYELCNNIFRYRSIYDAAGFQGLINGYGSSIANISVFSNAYDRPYGIRRHGSMMDEYYYDVQNLYKGLVEPRGFLERKNDD